MGSAENANDPLVPILYDQFIANCWSYRDRIIPMRMSTKEGLPLLLSSSIHPDFAYVDAGHDYDSVRYDITTCLKFGCPLIGDDFNPRQWSPVVTAIWDVAAKNHRDMKIHGSAWRIG